MVDIFNELLWPQFLKLEDIKKLPLNEQVVKYNTYLNELTNKRIQYQQQYIESGGGGFRYILLEDGYYLLNEDGTKIKLY